MESIPELNRRDFIKDSSLATLMMMMGGVAIGAEEKPATSDGSTNYKTTGAPVNCAVIGCGVWGREILKTLGRLPNAPVVAICDTYEAFLKRSESSAPQAEKFTDYKKLLEKKEVQAVIVATPSHQHKQVVLDALKAGKHVYCEAPMASTIEDAREIAKAAKENFKVNFAVGLQTRSDKQMTNLVGFVRTGVLGAMVKGRSQWHKKQSWRLASSNPEREKELNWRLRRDTSPGLIGEIGIHQLDFGGWCVGSLPSAVNGFGALVKWKEDGRDVPDTVQAILEYPGGIMHSNECTICSSFDSNYDVFYGTDSAVMTRDRKAWMFKEVDAQLLGWEVYAKKDTFYKETGIVLGANATKLSEQSKSADQSIADEKSALEYALAAFIANTNLIKSGVDDFASTFDANDLAAMKDYLAGLDKNRLAAAGFKEGFEATVVALKANEAILKNTRIEFQKDWFSLA